MPPQNLVDALTQLTEVLQTERTLGATLAQIAQAATVSVPKCTAASIAISLLGRPATAAITAKVALELDMVQYDSDEGPCLHAFQQAKALRIDLIEQGDLFPHFAVAATNLGVRSTLSVPSTWGGEVIATLNLYSRTGVFDETAETVALVLAAQVAIAVSRSPEFASARNVAESAQRDVDDQSDIAVATGLLMVNEDCTAEQAEGLLRSAATNDDRTIVEIAHRVLDQHRNAR